VPQAQGARGRDLRPRESDRQSAEDAYRMIITYWKGVFVADVLDEPGALKAAGFRKHDPSACRLDPTIRCRGCRAEIGSRWWTDQVECATRVLRWCNEKARRVMREHLERLRKSRAVDADIDIPLSEKARARGWAYAGYQRAGVAYALQRKDTLFGDDMGLGKTVEAICVANILVPRKMIVVCPATLVFNWADELATWIAHDREVMTLDSKAASAPPDEEGRKIAVVTNYEKLVGDSPLSRSLSGAWDLAIYDECQMIKNPESARARAILDPGALFDRTKRNLFLSGSPIENYPKEIWPIAAKCCPAKFGDRIAFMNAYCARHQEDRGDGRKVWVDTGASRLGELQQRLRATFMVRRLKRDVMPDLPPKRRQVIMLRDDRKDWSKDPQFMRWREAYDARLEAVMQRIEASRTEGEYREAVGALDRFTGVAFEEMSEVRHATALAKLPMCISLVKDMLSSGLKNLAIFAHHEDVISSLEKEFEDSCVVVAGKTPLKGPRSREAAVKAFQSGEKKIFIGQNRTAGQGLTLTATDTILCIEYDWSRGVMAQIEDRIYRIGQTRMCHIIVPILEGTLDVNIAKKLIEKADVIDRALDMLPEIRLRKRRGGAAEDRQLALETTA